MALASSTQILSAGSSPSKGLEMGTAFATLSEVQLLEGVSYDVDQMTRAEALLPLVSDLLRREGSAVGMDVDALVESDEAYSSVVRLVTCDVVARIMRQTTTGDAMSQESQSALGYSWSGTYAVPGGGASMSLMDKERKMLGFRQQKYGVIELWEAESTE